MAAFRKRVSVSASASISTTIVGATTGKRHHIQKGLVTIATVTGAAVAGIYETNSTGSDAAVFVGLWNASAKTAFSFDFTENGRPGDPGLVTSTTGCRLALVQLTASSTVNLHIVGYTG